MPAVALAPNAQPCTVPHRYKRHKCAHCGFPKPVLQVAAPQAANVPFQNAPKVWELYASVAHTTTASGDPDPFDYATVTLRARTDWSDDPDDLEVWIGDPIGQEQVFLPRGVYDDLVEANEAHGVETHALPWSEIPPELSNVVKHLADTWTAVQVLVVPGITRW